MILKLFGHLFDFYDENASSPREFFLCHFGEFAGSLNLPSSSYPAPLAWAVSSKNLPCSAQYFYPVVLCKILLCYLISGYRYDDFVIFCIKNPNIITPRCRKMRTLLSCGCNSDSFRFIENLSAYSLYLEQTTPPALLFSLSSPLSMHYLTATIPSHIIPSMLTLVKHTLTDAGSSWTTSVV